MSTGARASNSTGRLEDYRAEDDGGVISSS